MSEAGIPTAPFRDAPRGGTAMLIVDMIGTMEFASAKTMAEDLARAAEAIARLREQCAAAKVPVIFANDNFGEWHSDAPRLVDRALEQDSQGRAIAKRLRPTPADYFIIKPSYSAFYATNLPVLLPKLGVSRLIVTGTAADMCVLFTAGDARMRDYQLWIPGDAIAAPSPERKGWVLDLAGKNLDAETRATTDYTLAAWLAAADRSEATEKD